MSYTLTRRQAMAYTDRFDIYAKAAPRRNVNNQQLNVLYSATPVAKQVRCLWMNHPDINELHEPMGRTLSEMADTLDVVHFPVGVDVKDQYALQCKTKGHPQFGEWFIVMGFGALRISRGKRQGNYLEVRLKRMMAPPGLEGGSA